MTELVIHKVERVTVPDGYTRNRAISAAGLAPESHARYDFDTFFYQATRVGNDVVLVAPKLLNFRRLFRQVQFTISGQAVDRVQIFSFYRHAVIWLRRAPKGGVLNVKFPDGSDASTPIVAENYGLFADQNTQMIISKDNDLRWIRDQLSFHAGECGVEALCFIDNGSTAYSLEQLASVIGSVGLKSAALVSMPYTWGGVNRKPVHRELYLQTAAYNLVRLQYLARARAVVRLDADEMLMPKPKGETVFDLARKSRGGFVRFVGRNRYPGPDDVPPVDFKDHRWVRTGGDVAGNNWCINPQGPLGRFQWRCHNLEHNVFDKFQMLDGDYFYHCLGIGTGWKSPDRASSEEKLSHSDVDAQFWDEVFAPAVERMPWAGGEQ